MLGHYPSILYLLLLIISKFYLQLHHLMNTLIANETNSLVSNFFICICRVLWNLVHLTCDQIQEASNVDGRWCIKSGAGQITSFKGLLLSRWTLHAAKIVYFFFWTCKLSESCNFCPWFTLFYVYDILGVKGIHGEGVVGDKLRRMKVSGGGVGGSNSW